jgi:tetratricopeptide (TPR) repeat protein
VDNRTKSAHDAEEAVARSSRAFRHLVFEAALHHHQAGHLQDAEHLCGAVLAQNPNHADSLHLLAAIAYQAQCHDRALDLVRQAMSAEIAATSGDGTRNHISSLLAFNTAIAVTHTDLGTMLLQHGHLDEAIACYRRALVIRPNLAGAHSNLGIALTQKGLAEAAIACFQAALTIEPGFPKAYNNMGNALQHLGRLEDAVACFRSALAGEPESPQALNNLGNALKDLGQLNEAITSFRSALAIAPDYPEAHFNLATALLAQGDLAAGWPEYEWRWRAPQMIKAARGFAQPQWRGQSAEGRTLLIYAEQGFGDILQFCRYAPLAAARGLRVILEAPKPLARLLRSIPNVDRVVTFGEPLPHFDLQCPMLSMPLALGTTLATIPAPVPYLHADPAQVETWRRRLATTANKGPRIGLVWAGQSRSHVPALAAIDRRRSLPPDRLAPLFDLSDIHFVSLQKDGPKAPAHFPIVDVMPEMEDFADTAALIANLDLVISVDTAVAHLAAALGKPVWLLDRFDSCWRWFTGRRDSPWYPTLRVYRQPRPNDWDSVLAEVARDLATFG